MQQLEDRRLLAVLSEPSQVLPTVNEPVAIGVGTFNSDANPDAVVLGRAGDLTLASRGPGDNWQTIDTIDTGLGPQQMLIAERLGADPYSDLILLGADSISILHNDLVGGFDLVQSLAAPSANAFGSNGTNTLSVDFVDGDPARDLVVLAPADGSVFVYPGLAGGTFAEPTKFLTGVADPTTVVVTDVIGDQMPDLVVGHEDGSIVFFEGSADAGILLRRDDLTLSEPTAIVAFGEGDFDADGNADLAVTTRADAFVLFGQADPRGDSPIINGGFSTGLTGWETEIVGHADSMNPGSVSALGGAVQLRENESFLTSVKQTIEIPDGAQSISFDLVALGLDPVVPGGIPDAFEVSLLDADERSLVATHIPESTAFFNLSSGSLPLLASGVTVSGTQITLDVSTLATGTEATLAFDLIGNPPGTGSVASIDNVSISPDRVFADTFDRVTVGGVVGDAIDASVGDVDGDGNLDLVVIDGASDSLAVFNGAGDRTFASDVISLSGFGSGVSSIETRPLTSGDSVDDILVTLADADLALSPIGADVTAPMVILTDPVAGQTLTSFSGTATVEFNEPVRESGLGSVNNLDAYRLIGSGVDRTFGTSDDAVLVLDSVAYDVATLTAAVTVSTASWPFADDHYRLTLAGADPALAIRDTTGNPIGGGTDVDFEFTVDAPLALDALDSVVGVEGESVTVVADFNDPGRVGNYVATIDWGDGTSDNIALAYGASGFEGTLSADHIYADNATYGVSITLADGDGQTATDESNVEIGNAAPVLSGLMDLTAQENTLTTFTDIALVSDLGFAFGTREETFTATIDWGDGSPITEIDDIAEVAGSPNIPTIASISAAHTFTSEGIFDVNITVFDDDGGEASGTLRAFVSNTAPILAPISDVAANEGNVVSVSGTYTDDDLAGGSDPDTTHTVIIDWGDGTVVGVSPFASGDAEAAYSGQHVYADDGTYSVTVTVTDSGSGAAMQSATATISGTAPTVVPASDAAAVAGAPMTFAIATFTDPGFTRATAGTEETFTVSIDWGDGSSSDFDADMVSNGSPGVLTVGSISAQHTFGSSGVYTATATITDDDGLSATASIQISVEDSGPAGGACLPTIDFENGLSGMAIRSGEVVTDQWALWGVHITTNDPLNRPAMIFDSSAPSGGDTDLGSPHSDFGGPGVGSGGASGAAGQNDSSLGNVLIISEDGDSSDPDDDASGGTFIFTFENPVQLDEIGLIDLDSSEDSTITLFDSSGTMVGITTIAGLGNNAVQTVALDADEIARMEIELAGSGAITDLIFCRDLPAMSVEGAATADEGAPYDAVLLSPDVTVSDWNVSIVNSAGSLVSSFEFADSDSPTLSTSFPDGEDEYRITGWASSGSDVYAIEEFTVSVSNVAPTLVISGEASVDAQVEYTLELASTDPGDDDILQWTVDWGDGNLRSVDGASDSVTHVYATAGNYTITASAIDEDNVDVGAFGLIVLEAENFAASVSGTDDASDSGWTSMTDTAASSQGYLLASPNSGVNVGDSTKGPRLDYTVTFPSPGTYYVWIRMLGASGSDDSVHFGINGQPSTYGKNGLTDRSGSWHWENKVSGRGGPDRVKIEVPNAGTQTLNLWMREDGTAVDKIVLSDDPSYVPADLGPQADFAGDAYVSNSINVNVDPGASLWLPNVDFSVDASGYSLSAGDRITDQFASMGFTVSTHDPNKPAMIFDSASPTGGDTDLGTPNEQYGGPGQGAGGASNSDPQGNVLIISEDGNADHPDDDSSGGVLSFDFMQAVMVDEIGFLDVQGGDNRIDLFDVDDNLISSTEIPDSGNNGYARVSVNALHVLRMEVHFAGSGAVTDIEFCRHGANIPAVATRFFVTDSVTDDIYRYETSGIQLGEIDAAAAFDPRGITTTGEGNPVWVISEEGTDERVYVYDTESGTLTGDWTARGLTTAEGIATDGADIWIIDDGIDKVKRYTGAASRSSGEQSAASEFQLAFGNSDPRGVTTDGQTLWTVDGVSNKVFAYEMDGTFINWWNLDPENDDPAGITINPAGGDGVWVVDATDGAVYHYANATLPYQGDQAAVSTFDLGAGNTRPTGIADPAFLINVGDSVSGTLIDTGQVDEYEFTKGFGPLFIQVESVNGGDIRLNYDAPFGVGMATGIFGPGEVTELSYFDPGTFTFSVSVGSGTPDYSVSLLEPPDPSFGSINQGDTVIDSIDAAYATDIWDFSGAAGQTISIDVASDNFDLVLDIVDTSSGGGLGGPPVFSGPFADTGPITLPSTGIYEIAVFSLTGATAPYEFTLGGASLPSITLGTPVIGDILSPGEADAYALTGLAGQTLNFDVVAADLFTFSLVGPSGQTIFSELMADFSGAGIDQNEVILPETGDYTVTIDSDGGEGFSTGPYEFVVVEPIISSIPIDIGDSLSSDIGVSGEIDRYVFTVGSDQAIELDFTSLAGGSLVSMITDSAGNLISSVVSGTADDHDFGPQITVPGTYTLQLTGDGSGTPSYVFSLLDAPYVPAALLDGDSVTNGINNAGELDVYTFAAGAGDRIGVSFNSVSTELISELVAPSGAVLRSVTSDLPFSHTIFDLEAAETGLYTLRLSGSSGDTPTYGFDFTRAIVNPPVPIAIGQGVVDDIDVRREINQYTFEASANDAFFVNYNSLVGGTIQTAVIDPNGSVLANTFSDSADTHDSGRIIAPVDGTYTIRVGGVDEDLAAFEFRLDVAPEDNQTIAFGPVYFGEIESPGAIDTYDFQAEQGDSLFVDFLWLQKPVGADFNRLDATLLRPNGDVILDTTASAENQLDGVVIDLPETGEYRLVVAGTGDDLMQYEFRVNDVTPRAATPVAIGQVVSDSLDVAGETITYAFATTAGTELTLDVLFNEGYLFVPSFDLSIVAPSGNVEVNDVNSDTTFVATETGQYQIVIDNRDSSPADLTGDFSFRLVADPATSEPDSADLIVSAVTADTVAVGNPGQVQVSWTVTNVGTVEATGWDSGPWIDRIIVSNDDDSPDVPDRVFAEVPRETSLLPGESYTATTTITLPDDLEGAFWVFVETNAVNRVYEGTESNNNTTRAESLTAVFPADRPTSGGPAIEVAPEDGSFYASGTDLTLSGNVGRGNQSVNAIFVVDVSLSTLEVTDLDVNGDGVADSADDLNGDGSVGDILDAEIGAAIRLTDQLESRSDNVRVSTVLFAGSSTVMDGGPERFNQVFADPAADTTYDGDETNFATALRELTGDVTGAFRPDAVTSGTSFGPPILDVKELLAASQPTDRTLVYFLTDGEAFDPGPIPVNGVADQGIEFFAFQLGGASVTAELDELANSIDADPSSTGQAIAVSSIEQLSNQLISTIEVDSVTVNGVPVSAIDAAGNFFAPVTIASGANPFSIVATTTAGTSSETTITLFGDDVGPTIDFNSLEPGAAGLEAAFTGTTFNRSTNELHVSLAVDNQSVESVTPPLIATIRDIDPVSVIVSNAEGETPDGDAYFVYDAEIDPVLAIGGTSGSSPLTLSNVNRSRFSLDVQFQTTGNTSPVFTGTPILIADVDQAYAYSVDSFDNENDLIVVSLLEGPSAMTLSGNVLNWTPTVADAGHHRVRIEISDGRGGTATQEFTLLVPSGLANNPPLILSTPQDFTTVGETFTYDILAIDPEGSSIDFTVDAPTPTGVEISGTRLTWTPDTTQLGANTFTVIATDAEGAVGRQTFGLSVRGSNLGPTFTTAPITSSLAGEQYFYPAVADDSEDAVTYSISGPAGMTVDGETGRVVWPASFVLPGSYPIVVTATDDRGLATDQDYTLTVSNDDQPPMVDIASTTNVLDLGDTARITVFALDNVGVVGTSLTIDGVVVSLDADSGFDYVADTPGIKDVVFTAIDAAGNVASVTLDPFLRVIDPADTTAPVIDLASPLPGDVVTYLTDIVGTVTDDNLEYYEVQVALSGTEEFRAVSRNSFLPGPGGNGIVNDVLGTFDPSLLANDIYDIRIVAQDVSGNLSRLTTSLSVEGNAKLGNFRIELTDLMIPVAGIPIQINRIYDTLDSPFDGDFGYGWKLDVASPRIRESIPVAEAEAAGAGIFGANAFRIGSRVYLNAPDGRRVGFTFDPIPEPQLLGTLWRPRFVADTGVFHELEVDEVALQQNTDGTFGLYLLGFPYNPETYTLVTKDQMRYTYNQFEEIELQTIEDRNNVVLTFDEFGIHSSAGPEVTWTRDEFGRITEIIDPSGNSLIYDYSTSGDLVAVTNSVGDTTTMAYLNEPAHYLESITDARGITIASSQYDEQGRLVGETDGRGSVATRQYDLPQNVEILGDRLGNNTQLIFDDRGNTVEMVDPLGNSMFMAYDADDNLIAHTDRDGFLTTMSYDDRGNLLSVTDAVGGVHTYEYDDRNEITKVTDALGRESRFTFDANGNLESTINAAGDVTSVTRDGFGRQLTFTDQFGLVTRFEYDTATFSASRVIWPDGTSRQYRVSPKGMITSMTDERGNESQFFFDGSGRRTELIDADGGSIRFGYTDGFLTSMSDQLNRVTNYQYDANGQVVTHVDASGNAMQYVRDAEGRVVETLDPEGRRIFTTYDAIGNITEQTINPTYNYVYNRRGDVVAEISETGAVTQYDYDALGRIETITSPEGRTQTYVYDAGGNVVELIDALGTTLFEYNVFNEVTKITDPLGISESWTYDEVGNVTSYTDGEGNTWTFDINNAKRSVVPATNLVSAIRFAGGRNDQLVTATDPLGNTTTYAYDDAGNLLSQMDALGRVYSFEYDSQNRLTRLTDPSVNFVTFEYDEVGNQSRFTDERGNATEYEYDLTDNLIKVIDALGQETSYSYDGNDNLTVFRDEAGNATLFTYDNLDRVTKEENALGHSILYEYDADSNLLSYTDQQGSQWKFEYDLDQLMTQTEMPDGGIYGFAYDAVGLRTEETDPLGRVTRYEYDAASRLTKETDPDGFDILYTYDDRHLLTSFTDGAGNVRGYGYDAIGRLVSDTDALGNSSSYEYDAVDNLTGMVDRLGRRIEYGYDDLDRVLEERWIGSPESRVISFSYDAYGNLLTAGDADSQYQFQYDALNRVITDDNLGTPIVPRNRLTYEYDSRGNLETIGDLAGTQVQMVYDQINRPVEISWSGGGVTPVLVEMDYNTRDGLSQIRRYANNGTATLAGVSNYTFDTSGRMTRLEHLDDAGTEISAFDYGYNLANELISTTDRGILREYDRDDRGQITSVTDPTGVLEQFAFDGAGNRNSADDQVSVGNRLDSDGVYNYEYDAIGNLIGKTRISDGQVTNYTYDYRNRLTSTVVTSAGGVIETDVDFVYDVFDRKIIREVDGVIQTTAYDGFHVWADHGAEGSVIAKYLHGTEAIDHLLARDKPGEGTAWYLQDRLFSVRDIVDSDGNLLDSIDYDTFGNITSESDPSEGDRFKFTGREWEESIGLYDYRARHYDPETGRFISEDSWGISAGDPNFYRYVGNNPTDFIDPSGHVAASTYAAMVSGIIFTIIDVDFSCFTESGMVFSVGVGVPYTDVYQEVYSHEAKGPGIPTPAGIDVQIMSCALLGIAAWSNGVFAQFSTVLSLLSPSESDPPRDCTIYSDVRSYGSLSDYSVFVRASCGGGENPFYVVNNDERLEIHTGYNDDPHSNCFIAGTHVLVVQQNTDEKDKQSGLQLAAMDWNPVIVGAVGLAAVFGVAKSGKKSRQNDVVESAVDEFWSGFEPEPPGLGERFDEGLVELPLRRQPVQSSEVHGSGESIEDTNGASQGSFNHATSELSEEGKTPSFGRLYRWTLAVILMIACSLPFVGKRSSENPFQQAASTTVYSTPAYSTTIASRPIESIVPGDTVLAWDEELQREVPRKVLRVFRNTTDHIHRITITSSDGRRQTIGTTCTHPFWVVGEGWIDASTLQIGDPLQEPGGNISRVTGHETEFSDEGIATYNFEVEGSHTYFAAASASSDAVLVHNMSKRPRYGKTRIRIPANAKKLRLRKRAADPACDVDTPRVRQSGSRAKPKRKPGTQGQMGNNQDENQRARAAANAAKLNKDQRTRFHREISGQGINDFETLKQIAQDIKNGLL